MIKIGYKLMSEEHGPADLVRNAQRAERAGFDFAAISDHYFPWLPEQGHAPFAWSVLGALAQATERMGLMTAVTCPIMRYHPAIIAQATATMGLLSGDRFTLGVGAGERLNEHVVGEGWPGVVERHERLSEALDIIQGLLVGALATYRGAYFQLDHARLFDRPGRKPPVIMAAGGLDAAHLAAEKTDGLIVTEPRHELINAFTKAGGKGPRYCEVALCVAPDEAAGRRRPPRSSRRPPAKPRVRWRGRSQHGCAGGFRPKYRDGGGGCVQGHRAPAVGRRGRPNRRRRCCVHLPRRCGR